mmetsp:Transcript_28411/g.61753  ORF Transcript_28411/g.61753 Transcript_28411/m.61753 type:complete len:81 (-) Transcript_28411:40-282(-)
MRSSALSLAQLSLALFSPLAPLAVVFSAACCLGHAVRGVAAAAEHSSGPTRPEARCCGGAAAVLRRCCGGCGGGGSRSSS